MSQVKQFLELLERQGDSVRAAYDKNYHKSNRRHLGVRVPLCDTLVRSYTEGYSEPELLSLAEELWRTDLFDAMVCAIKIMSLKRVKASPALWQMVVDFMDDVDGWGLEDGLAHSAWKCIAADEGLLHTLEGWTAHENFWWRRAALIFTLPYAKKGKDPERMLRWASGYVTDSEWFIQKAIGWWLRVLGEHNPERVLVFLEEHWHKLKGVARKEATRKLNPALLERCQFT